MVLAANPTLNFIPKDGGFMDQLFHQTWIKVSVFGNPSGGYQITLIGLLLIVLIAIVVNTITEKLTKAPVGAKLFSAIIVTFFASLITAAFLKLPFDIVVETVPLLAVFVTAIIIAVFWNLIRSSMKGGK